MVHYYLEMAPQSLESVTGMGFSLMDGDLQKEYPRLRAMGFARAAKAYLQRYPDDANLVLQIRKMTDTAGLCWFGKQLANTNSACPHSTFQVHRWTKIH